MARKWSNQNLPGALHFVTGSLHRRAPVFTQEVCCRAFLDVCAALREEWPCKLVAYVLMPDHFHLIVNPRDGRIKELAGALKSLSAKHIIKTARGFHFSRVKPDADGSIHQVWQESFKDLPLWSPWMVWQKINYIHANPLKARLVVSTRDYRWSSYRAFYLKEDEPLEVDQDWWWPDDAQKLKRAAKNLAGKEKN
ncbi:MAG: transposase [Acidobacteria bacterium]|nr:transposase [Acidobacteriota bacterium]